MGTCGGAGHLRRVFHGRCPIGRMMVDSRRPTKVSALSPCASSPELATPINRAIRVISQTVSELSGEANTGRVLYENAGTMKSEQFQGIPPSFGNCSITLGQRRCDSRQRVGERKGRAIPVLSSSIFSGWSAFRRARLQLVRGASRPRAAGSGRPDASSCRGREPGPAGRSRS